MFTVDGGGYLDVSSTTLTGNVRGQVTLNDRLPSLVGTTLAPAVGWRVATADGPHLFATTSADGSFAITGATTALFRGVPVAYLIVTSVEDQPLGNYTLVAADDVQHRVGAFTRAQLNAAVAVHGRVPSVGDGYILATVRDTNTSLPVAGVQVTTAGATTYYDVDGDPTNLAPTANGTGSQGIALLVDVPPTDANTGGIVTLQVAGSAPVSVRVFPNTITPLAVNITR